MRSRPLNIRLTILASIVFGFLGICLAAAVQSSASATVLSTATPTTSALQLTQTGIAVEQVNLDNTLQSIQIAVTQTAQAQQRATLNALQGTFSTTATPASAAPSNTLLYTLSSHTNSVESVAYSPDSDTVLTGSLDHTAILWNAHTGTKLRTLVGHTDGIRTVAYSPDGRTVVTGGWDNTAILWDVATGTILHKLLGHTDYVISSAFTPDGRSVLTGGYGSDSRVILWDVQSGTQIRTFDGHTTGIYGLAVSPDGNTFVSGSADNKVILWDINTGSQIRTFDGHTKGVYAAAFSPDGNTILTDGPDKATILWDVQTGEKLHTFVGHDNLVYRIAFSPDGKSFLTGSGLDKTAAVLRDIQTGATLRTFAGHTAQVWNVAFSPDGKSVMTASADKTARLWDVSDLAIVPLAVAAAPTLIHNPSPTAQAVTVTDVCLAHGTLSVASDTTYPPFESVDSTTGKIAGFDVDLLAAIAQAEGLKVKFVTENFDTIFSKLSSGSYDMVMSAATITAERAVTVSFSKPYFLSSQVIVVRQSDVNHYKTLPDLNGLRIGVQKGTTGESYVTSNAPSSTAVGYDLAPQAFQALVNHEVAAVIIDSPIALNILATNPQYNLVVAVDSYSPESYGIAVRKECSGLLSTINAGLAAVIADGTYNTVYRQYFGQDAPAAFRSGTTASSISPTDTPTAMLFRHPSVTPRVTATVSGPSTTFSGATKTFTSTYGYQLDYYAAWPLPLDSDRTKSKTPSDNQTYMGSDTVAELTASTQGILPLTRGNLALTITTLQSGVTDPLLTAQGIYDQTQQTKSLNLTRPQTVPVNGYFVAYMDLLGKASDSNVARFVLVRLSTQREALVVVYAPAGEMTAAFTKALPIIAALRLTGSGTAS